MMELEEKQKRLKEIEELLTTYGGELEIAPYVLNYLSLEELETIIVNILKKQSNVIEENHEWLQQFKKYLKEP
ncbi:MAG: hypothetical protein DSZ05_09525 [Sulfurospirillum sp.]|nr:MAG: hypothetical protein DSZ05_09525 [Sulfurospirillum sp.]